MNLEIILSQFISLLIVTATIALGFIVAAVIMKYFGRYILYKSNVKTQYILYVQIGYLFGFALLFVVVQFVLWKALPQVDASSREIKAVIFRGTPEETINRYYAALNQGINGDDFWDAYDLWSTSQQTKYHYDQFRLALKGTQCIHIGKITLLAQTADRAVIVAEITAIVEEDGMLKTRTEQVDHDLKIEEGWWRVESIHPERIAESTLTRKNNM